MGDYATPVSAENSDTDWFTCTQWDTCGYLGVHPNGTDEKCPDCGSGLERFGGRVYKCNTCETEYLLQGEAQDCCQ